MATTVRGRCQSWPRIGADERYRPFSLALSGSDVVVSDKIQGAVFDIGKPCLVEHHRLLAGMIQSLRGDGMAFDIYHACHRELCAHETTSPFKIVNFLELVGEAMGVEKTDLFKQWKMMQDVDRVLAEVAKQATATGLDLETVREVLVAHILDEQPLPVGFRGAPAIASEARPVRVISE